MESKEKIQYMKCSGCGRHYDKKSYELANTYGAKCRSRGQMWCSIVLEVRGKEDPLPNYVGVKVREAKPTPYIDPVLKELKHRRNYYVA